MLCIVVIDELVSFGNFILHHFAKTLKIADENYEMMILSFLLLYVSWWVTFGSIIDDRSFITRENSMKLLELANQKLLMSDSDVHEEILTILKTSFQYYPTSTVARKLAWVSDMLGDSHDTYFWQQNQARLEDPLMLSWINEGIRMHYKGEYYRALEYYDMILNVDPSNVDALYHKGVSYQYLGDIQNAADYYYAAIELEPTHSKAILNLAALHQKYGSYEDAVSYYLKGVELFDHLTGTGGSVPGGEFTGGEPKGDLQPSSKLSYLHPHQVMVHYNLGLAYLQLNQLDKAYQITKQLLNKLYTIEHLLESDTASVKDQYNAWEIKQSIGGALGSLSKIQRASLNWGNWEWLNEQQVTYTLLGITHNQEHYCDNISFMQETCDIEDYYKHKKQKVPFLGPLLPFDTLMMPLSPSIRLEIATATSLSYQYQPYQEDSVEHSLEYSNENRKRDGVLRLGFISYDFTDHPTAHLIEAIFLIIAAATKKTGCHKNTYDDYYHHNSNNICTSSNISNSSDNNSNIPIDDVTNIQLNNGTNIQSACKTSLFSSVELIVFSYGKDDGSRYRQSIQTLAHKFIDIVQMPFYHAAEAVRTEDLDILLDLQIHTLGSRLEITAAGVAPTVINYLVFPGTSGASFYHYICADEIVIPPEHASFYTEALLLLPPTYQISSYDHIGSPPELVAVVTELQQEQQQQKGFEEETIAVQRKDRNRKTAMRKMFGLPTQAEAVVLCNFNKINKIDPDSFALWMQVMRAVPNSYLWLIEPSQAGGSASSSSKASLLRAVTAEGVETKRIIFAPKMSKSGHIFRHGAADLFLDTVVYGAHSTATDALRGGLPVLTLRGEAFPARVAASLYASFAYPAQPKRVEAQEREGLDSDRNSNVMMDLERQQEHEQDGEEEVVQEYVAAARRVLGDLLVTDTAKDFVDTAVRLVQGYYQSSSIRTSSSRSRSSRPQRIANRVSLTLTGLTDLLHTTIVHNGGLFNSTHNVEIFVRSMQVVKEVYSAEDSFDVPLQKRFHAIIR